MLGFVGLEHLVSEHVISLSRFMTLEVSVLFSLSLLTSSR